MAQFKKKPVVIEAEQWHPPEGDHAEGTLRIEVCTGANVVYRQARGAMSSGGWYIETLEGPMRVSPGDWIIRL